MTKTVAVVGVTGNQVSMGVNGSDQIILALLATSLTRTGLLGRSSVSQRARMESPRRHPRPLQVGSYKNVISRRRSSRWRS